MVPAPALDDYGVSGMGEYGAAQGGPPKKQKCKVCGALESHTKPFRRSPRGRLATINEERMGKVTVRQALPKGTVSRTLCSKRREGKPVRHLRFCKADPLHELLQKSNRK